MEGFISFILFTILGFYLLGWIGKMVLRYWLLKKQREFQQQFSGQRQGGSYGRTYTWGFGGGQQQQQQRGPSKEKEGDITVESTQNNSGKRISKDVGEYVDYEEIKR